MNDSDLKPTGGVEASSGANGLPGQSSSGSDALTLRVKELEQEREGLLREIEKLKRANWTYKSYALAVAEDGCSDEEIERALQAADKGLCQDFGEFIRQLDESL